MRIALYYPWIYLKSGVERTIIEITRRSRHSWTIFTNHYDQGRTYNEFKDIDVVRLSRIPVERGYLKVGIAALKIISQKIDLSKYDALMVNSEGLGDFITFRNHSIPVICFCYTPLKVVHDPFMRASYLRNNILKAPLYLMSSMAFDIIDKAAWKNYSHVISISEEVKKRILKANLAKESSIDILRGGVDCKKIIPSWHYGNYFFHPGRIKWYKNIELSISAFNIFCQNNKDLDFELKIAGHLDKRSIPYYKYLKALSKLNPKIKIIPNPDNDLYQALFQNSYAALSTSPNEDLGLVELEAMAYGKPVIAINQGGPKETIKDTETGFLVPLSAKDISEKLKLLARDKALVLKIGKAGRESSLDYGWDIVIEKLDNLIISWQIQNTLTPVSA